MSKILHILRAGTRRTIRLNSKLHSYAMSVFRKSNRTEATSSYRGLLQNRLLVEFNYQW